MDYSKLSDNKINAEVALHWLGKGNFGLMNGAVEKFGGSFNPCNNAADAWPIIVGNAIGVMPFKKGEAEAWSLSAGLLSNTTVKDIKPLRAAMIVYLKMQGSE